MIEVNNLTRRSIDEDYLKRLAKKVLKRENRVLDISIVLVGQKRMKDLNKKHRRKDEVTDVLSFAEGLNEIVICLSAVDDLAEALIHGLLHILGYEHSEKMFKKQGNYLNKWQNHTL